MDEELAEADGMQAETAPRALANHPVLPLADEPTGQLDAETGHGVTELLRAVVPDDDAQDGRAVTALAATHDEPLLDLAGRVVELEDGALHERARNQGPGPGPDRNAATPAP